MLQKSAVFLVMGVIVKFTGLKECEWKYNGVSFSIRGCRWRDCSEGVIQGVCLENYVSIWYP